MEGHNFVQLANVQKYGQKTLYCGGLDIHQWGNPEKMPLNLLLQANMGVYGFRNDGKINESAPAFSFYLQVVQLAMVNQRMVERFAGLLAAIEDYVCYVVEIAVKKCNVRVFKPQSAFYEQFGPSGMFLLQRIRAYIRQLEEELDIRIICMLDCKRGDIDTTQAAYFRGFLGNLRAWGIDHTPFDFDMINVTPFMGKDVLVLEDKKGNPLYGLKLLREGKGIIVVDKTSNPSGPDYQDQTFKDLDEDLTFSEVVARDIYLLCQKHGLEQDGLAPFGLVVGSTHPCDGSLRRVFPTYTGLNPGFGAQKGDFMNVMLELIRTGKWNGLGGIFSASRGTLFPYVEKYGGSGKVANLEADLIVAIDRHREQEREAYKNPLVVEAGIEYPFDIVA
ncbi:MAG: orotidine-5'-phosphate decarboxylase [Patescibacteria group bacterium]|nr:orotidine-5'-phosphate decarboxylase [Patescibacteria group bacterium]MDD4610492.1 orotidine-5'-phosphate decarboxylase [Patescibacteria group bacterium]